MERLPIELVEMISGHLTAQELATCCAVSHMWRDIFNQDLLWRCHCERTLEEYLQTTPSVVEPVFVSPESEDTTLSPICQWRLSFMRENHLWNNWRTGNCKTQVIETKDSKSFYNNGARYNFLTNDYVVIYFEDRFELWDVTQDPASKVSETFENVLGHSTFMIGGNNKEIIVLTNEYGVQVFFMDAAKQIVMKHFVSIHEEEKMPDEKLVSATKTFEQDEEDSGKILYCCVLGQYYLTLMKRSIDIWDLESGQKLKSDQCPLDISFTFFIVIYYEPCTNVILVATSAKTSVLLFGRFPETYVYLVYSFTSLAFLPFTQKSEKSFGYSCCLDDSFIGISDSGGVRVYDYKNSHLLFQITATREITSKLIFVNNNFVFSHDDKLKMFDTLNKTIKSFSRHEVYDFRTIGGRFLELITDNDFPCLNRVWEIGESLQLTEMRSSEILRVNHACTRLFYEEDPFDIYEEDFAEDKEPEEEFRILMKHFW